MYIYFPGEITSDNILNYSFLTGFNNIILGRGNIPPKSFLEEKDTSFIQLIFKACESNY